MTYSIVIPAKDRQAHLDWCLKGIFWQEHGDYEVIVANYDENPSLTVPGGVKLLRWRGEGWNQSVALNLGLAHAQGERVIVLNCDNIMAPDLFSIVHGGWHDNVQLYWRRFDLNQAGTDYVRDNGEACFASMDWAEDRGEWHGMHAYGDFMATDRARLIEMGGFDEEMSGWGYMDFDMRIRLERCGYVVTWNTSFRLLHQYHEPIFSEERQQETHDRNRSISSSKQGVVRNQGPRTFDKYMEGQV